MIQRPNAVGLILCQQVIVEAGTKNVTLVNTFVHLKQKVFPTPELQFLVYGFLADGLGEMTLSLFLLRLDSLDRMIKATTKVKFDSPLQEFRFLYRLPPIRFPEPGRYEFTLLADGEWVAQRVVTLVAEED